MKFKASKPATTRGRKTRVTSRKRGGSLKKVLIALAALFFVGVIGGGLFITREIGGKDVQIATEFQVEIPDGATTQMVAEILKENDLIGSELVFRVYSRLTKADGTFQLGMHNFNQRMGYAEIVTELQTMTEPMVETFTITFTEGTTALKMGMLLEQKTDNITKEDFVRACNNDTYDVSFWNEISSNPDKFIKIEGFLFPDTYEFEVGTDAHTIVQTMLENFEEKVLTEERMALFKSRGYTMEEVIIMASVIEKESFGEESYPNVASVFYNRLENWDPAVLDSDTSRDWVVAGLGHIDFYREKGFIPGVLGFWYGGYDNIPVATREGYDTYNHNGIIIGAICNPGLNAIDASLQPNETDYYFFFTGVPDGKTYYYSETLGEHERQWALYGMD